MRLHHWHRRHPPLPLAAKRDEFENPPIIVNSSHAPHTTSLLSSTTQSLATSSGKDNIASQFPHAKNSIRFACIFFPLHSSSFSPSDRRRLLIGLLGLRSPRVLWSGKYTCTFRRAEEDTLRCCLRRLRRLRRLLLLPFFFVFFSASSSISFSSSRADSSGTRNEEQPVVFLLLLLLLEEEEKEEEEERSATS